MDSQHWRRAKVGLILPSVNTVTEPLFYSVAPKRIAFFTTRVLTERSNLGDAKAGILQMEAQKERAARELASARVDLIVDCCTGAGILRGLEGEGEQAFCKRLEDLTGIPTTTTLSAILEAFALLNVHKPVITSPYQNAIDEMEKKFLENQGFSVVNIRGFNLSDGCAYADISPWEIYHFSKNAWDQRADGLFMSCMNFNAVPVIEALEADLHVPVVSSNSATLWKILKMTKIDEPVGHCGRLLSEFI